VQQGCSRKPEAKGIDIMGTTELQGPSKRIRIVLCMLVALAVTAAVPASAFAVEWGSRPAPAVEWGS